MHAVSWADVVVTNVGSHGAYAGLGLRRGAVLITVYAYLGMFVRGPIGVTEMAYYSGLKLLDIVLFEKLETPRNRQLSGNLALCKGVDYVAASRPGMDHCQALHNMNDTVVPPNVLEVHLRRADAMLDESAVKPACELSLYRPCEPSEASLCANDPGCASLKELVGSEYDMPAIQRGEHTRIYRHTPMNGPPGALQCVRGGEH